MFPARLVVDPDSVLGPSARPLEERLALTPPDHLLKGMFFADVLTELGPDAVQRLLPTLDAPPRLGRYLPFSDYPQRDHARLVLALVRRSGTFPREAIRRLHQRNARRFAESGAGKILMHLAVDARRVLLAMPRVHAMTGKSGHCEARDTGRGVRLSYRDWSPWLDCSTLGNLEGAVAFMGRKAHIEAELTSLTDADFDVRWY